MILMAMITVRSSRREEQIGGKVKKNKKEK